MKRILIISGIVLLTNLLLGLVISSYAGLHLLFTSMAIVLNTLLLFATFIRPMKSTHRYSLGMVFFAIGGLEFLTGFFAPQTWHDNWWLVMTLVLTCVQIIVLVLNFTLAKES